jgi:hypothetical protein
MFERLLDQLFVREEMDGNDRCPLYLVRWTLFQPRWLRSFWRGFGIYVHKFVGDDWSLDLHDHPKRFISIGLKGSYREWTATPITTQNIYSTADGREIAHGDEKPLGFGEARIGRVYRAPWIRTFPAHHIHRIELLADRRPCWTLVIVLAHVREWGFYHRGAFVHWREYVHRDNRLATSRRSCQ